MRVSDKMRQTTMLTNLNKNRSELTELQNQAASQKKVTKPSDDPTGVAKIMHNKSELKKLDQFDRNIFYARTFLESTESTLSQLGEAIVRAKELAVQAASDTNAGMPREMIGSEVTQLYNSVVELSNRKFGDRYLFSGFKTTDAPFDSDGRYAGDDGQIQVQNMSGTYMPINLVGSQVFLGNDLAYGGAVSREQYVPKTVEDLQKFKLNQIEEEFQKSEFMQNNLETRGPASINGQGKQSETDPVTKARGVNIFSALKGLEVSLKTNDKIGIQESLDSLDQAFNQVNLARAEVGGRVNQLNATQEGIQRASIDNKTYNSQLEDADVFQVMSDLSRSNQTLQATLETSAKFSNQSLMDFLR